MFALAQPVYYPAYNPYEGLLLQQELQCWRQLESYLRRWREAEDLERQRACEQALLQAEYERRCQVEYERRLRAEIERRRQQFDAERLRHSVFDVGVQDLFDAIYSGARPRFMSTRREQTPVEQNNPASENPAVQALPSPIGPPTPRLVPQFETEQFTKAKATHIDTAPFLASIQSVLNSFTTLQSNFSFPAQPDFLPSSSKLAYSPVNAPLHGYEHALTGLLSQLDAIEYFGDDEVRKARKEAVKTIEAELEKLDATRVEAWKRQSEPEVPPEPEVTSKPVPTLDPASVPLPRDTEDEETSNDVFETIQPLAIADTPISAESSIATSEPSASAQLSAVETLSSMPLSPPAQLS